MYFLLRRICPLVLACLLASCGAMPSRQQDDYIARIELLALLQTFNVDLLSHDSATLTLERWCADHRLAASARIVALRTRDAAKPIPDELRVRLNVAADEPIRYRRVQLVCGEGVLSEADNWYVPGRLTPEMNRQLDTTDEPFGKVVKPLGFQRRTIAVELLWSPLLSDWDTPGPGHARTYAGKPLRIPHAVLRHQAILYTSQRPFSGVVETYTNAIFDFGSYARMLDR